MRLKEVVIISGKGGTGKTSIAASFAVLSKKCVTADCDVDAPNMHILLNPAELKKKVVLSEKKAKIINEKCTLCSVCQDLCTFGAIERRTLKETVQLHINPLLCEGCGVCQRFCPSSSIEFKETESAQLIVSETRNGPMVSAKMFTGSKNSGKLVSLIKEKARSIAKEKNLDFILIDGPPGLSCPVISSLSGSSNAIVVTEPTFSAVSDLKRIVELLYKFKIQTAVIANKFDLNIEIFREIKNICKDSKIFFLGGVSFDMSIPELQSKKLTPVESNSKSSIEIRSIFEKFSQTFLKED